MSKIHFQIDVDGIAVAVSHEPRRFADHDHFEFTHPSVPGKAIPVSHTGYLSLFVHASHVEAAGGPEAFARSLCRAVLTQGHATPPDDEEEGEVEPAAGYQPSLFD